jgi:hypothetical protein
MMIIRGNPFLEIPIWTIWINPEYLRFRIRHAQDFGEFPLSHPDFDSAKKAQLPE